MKAWVVRELGGPDSMRFEAVDEGHPTGGVVRIHVKATAVNFFDSLLVAGQYQSKPPLPFVPGGELSGEVAAAPQDSGLKPGDRVMAMVDNMGLTRGGYAEIGRAHV